MKKIFARFRSVYFSVAGLVVGLITSGLPLAQAAFTDDFNPLLSELQFRSVALGNSTDKVEQKQKKACDKSIAAINKTADSLSDDLKTAGKVAKTLVKAFPSEFGSSYGYVITPAAAFSTNLATLVTNLFDGIQSDVQGALAQLQTTVNALPSGAAKTKAQAAITQAQAALAMADNASGLSPLARALGAALKAISKGQKTATRGASGSGSRSLTATVTSNSVNDNWVADVTSNPDFPTAEFVQSQGLLDITGSRASSGSSLSVSLCSGFTGTKGMYNLGGCGSYLVNSPFTVYAITSGTLNITTFNTSTHRLVAEFNFTAFDGTKTITVSNGHADVPLTVNP